MSDLQQISSSGPAAEAAATGAESISPEGKRVLIVATCVFALFFAVWVMFSIVGIKMRKELGISDGQFALLTAIPVLTGAVIRVPVGVIADKIGGRKTMIALLLIVAIPVYLLSRVHSYGMALVIALFIGLAGSSFAAGVAWVSAWVPAEKKGFALGIFGMGNIGASLTQLIAPTLVTVVAAGGIAGGVIGGGWRFVPVLYAALLVLAAIVVPFITPRHDRTPGGSRGFAELLAPLRYVRVWRFGFYYMTVFGAFVGVSLWLPKYYVDVYDLKLRAAGFLAASFVIVASLLRPVGGALADRYGGRTIMLVSLGTAATASFALNFPLSLTCFVAVVLLLAIGLGLGTAAVFTYIPQYFPNDVGAVGGLVGAIGAIGGFILPLTFALVQDLTGKPQTVFLVLLALVFYSAMFLAIAISNLRAPTDPLHRD